jgi:hypothetical protein
LFSELSNVWAEQVACARNAGAGIIDVDIPRQGGGIKLAVNRSNNLFNVMPMLAGDQFGREQPDQVEQRQCCDICFR